MLRRKRCKIGEEHENFAVLTTPRSLAMKYIDVKRTLAKRLRGGDALRYHMFPNEIDDFFTVGMSKC